MTPIDAPSDSPSPQPEPPEPPAAPVPPDAPAADAPDALAQLSAAVAAVRVAEGLQDMPRDRVGANLHCRCCGYNLRSVRLDDRCPECGAPVRRMLRPNTLAYADPSWLNRLRVGVALILPAALLLSLVLAAAILVDALMPDRAWGRQSPIAWWTAVGGALLPAVLSLAGTWVLTSREPYAWQSEQCLVFRTVLRVLAAAFLVGLVLAIVGRQTGGKALSAAGGVLWYAGALHYFACHAYLSRVAQRIPSRALSVQCTLLMAGMFWVPVGYFIAPGFLVFLYPEHVRAVAVVLGLLLTAWGVALHIQYLVVLSGSLRLARRQEKLLLRAESRRAVGTLEQAVPSGLVVEAP